MFYYLLLPSATVIRMYTADILLYRRQGTEQCTVTSKQKRPFVRSATRSSAHLTSQFKRANNVRDDQTGSDVWSGFSVKTRRRTRRRRRRSASHKLTENGMEIYTRWRALSVNFRVCFVSLCTLCALSLMWMLLYAQRQYKRNADVPDWCEYSALADGSFSWPADVSRYLEDYENLCSSTLTDRRLLAAAGRSGWIPDPGSSSDPGSSPDPSAANRSGSGDRRRRLELCPCLPRTIFRLDKGRLPGYENSSWREVELANANITSGGFWKPSLCVARQRVAIVVPYRQREKHLKVFLSVIHPVLQSQLIEYRIFVVEQLWPAIFNRAALMNIGFLEARKLGMFECYVFHDVDLLPEMNLNLYSCVRSPLHIGAYMNKWHYKLPYPEFFGGAMAIRGEDVEKINGFPNSFYGWGGEDDAIYCRILKADMPIYRHPVCISKTFMIKHSQDKTNPPNPRRFRYKTEYGANDGLNTAKYIISEKKESKLYTLIQVSIERSYDMECIVNKSLAPSVDGNYVDCYREENFLNQTLDCCHGRDNNIFCCDKSPYYSEFGHNEVRLFVVVVVITGLLVVYKRLSWPSCHR